VVVPPGAAAPLAVEQLVVEQRELLVPAWGLPALGMHYPGWTVGWILGQVL